MALLASGKIRRLVVVLVYLFLPLAVIEYPELERRLWVWANKPHKQG